MAVSGAYKKDQKLWRIHHLDNGGPLIISLHIFFFCIKSFVAERDGCRTEVRTIVWIFHGHPRDGLRIGFYSDEKNDKDCQKYDRPKHMFQKIRQRGMC